MAVTFEEHITLNTMGPESTDSYRATEFWAKKAGFKNYEITEYESFEKLFGNVDQGQFIVMPVGYCNRDKKEFKGWVDYHFRFHKDLDICDVFKLPTKEMVLVENTDFKIPKIVIQSATYQLAKGYMDIDENMACFCSSKVKALNEFIDKGYRYTICSKDCYEEKNMSKNPGYVIREIFKPMMLWVAYQVVDKPERIKIE